MYLAALYEGQIAVQENSLYGTKLIKIPIPRYIIFYNGKEETPERQELYLSDAYQKAEGGDEDQIKPCLELTATVLNINYGHNKDIMEQCRQLEEYSIFVERVRFHLVAKMSREDALEKAIEDCINQGILKELLLKNKSEVKKMLLTQFDEEKYLAMERADAREEGRTEGIEAIAIKMIQKGKSNEEIQEITDLAYEEIMNLRKIATAQ